MLISWLVILSVSLFQNEGTGCIAGTAWRRSETVSDVTVLILGTDISVDTDSTGTYVLSGLDSGIYSIQAVHSLHGPMMYYEERDSIEVVAGDTTYADLFDRARHYYPDEYRPYYYRTISLRIANPEERSLDGFVAHTSTSRIPVDRVEPDLFTIGVSGIFSTFYWSLPWMGEQQITIRDCPATRRYPVNLVAKPNITTQWAEILPLFSSVDTDGYPLALADLVYDEWCSENYRLIHTAIDPAGDGYSSSGSVYIKSSVALNNDNSWKMVSVFQDEIVTLNSDSSISRMQVIPDGSGCSISPSGKYVLFYSSNRNSTSWFLCNTQSEEIIQIDLFPELLPDDEVNYYGEATMVITPKRDMRVSNDGSILGVYDREIRTYYPSGQQNLFVNFQDLGNMERGWVHVGYSDNCENWVLLYAYSDKILLTGNNSTFETIDTEGIDAGRYTGVGISPSGRLLALTGRAGGFSLYNTETGLLTVLEDCDKTSISVFSPDDSKLAYVVYDQTGNTTCKVYNIANEVSLQNSFPVYSLRYVAEPVCLSNEGWLLMSLAGRAERGNRSTVSRYALMNPGGEIVWLGHHVTYSSRRVAGIYKINTLLPGEFSCVLSDGCLIHFLDFTEVE